MTEVIFKLSFLTLKESFYNLFYRRSNVINDYSYYFIEELSGCQIRHLCGCFLNTLWRVNNSFLPFIGPWQLKDSGQLVYYLIIRSFLKEGSARTCRDETPYGYHSPNCASNLKILNQLFLIVESFRLAPLLLLYCMSDEKRLTVVVLTYMLSNAYSTLTNYNAELHLHSTLKLFEEQLPKLLFNNYIII